MCKEEGVDAGCELCGEAEVDIYHAVEDLGRHGFVQLKDRVEP